MTVVRTVDRAVSSGEGVVPGCPRVTLILQMAPAGCWPLLRSGFQMPHAAPLVVATLLFVKLCVNC